MTYQLKIITSVDEFQGLQKEWNQLLAHSPADNYFLRWEWLWTWWQVFARNDDELRIMKIENRDKIVAIAPFYVRMKLLWGVFPVRQMMFLGTQEQSEGDVCSDYMNIIYKAGEEEQIVDKILKTIVKDKRCDEIYFPRMDRSSSIFPFVWKKFQDNRFLTSILNEYESPYINLPEAWDDYLKGLSGSMRSKIRRERKKLDALAGAVFIKAQTHDELKAGFEELVRLHQKRWESSGLPGSFSNEQFARFHRMIVPQMMDNGQLELVLLLAGDRCRAAVYNILYNNTTYFYQSGIDRDEKNIAFGYLAHSHCIEMAIRSGRKIYDFLPKGGTDDYKDRFANSVRMVCDLYVILNRSVKCLYWAEGFARRVYQKMRRYYTRK